MDFEVTDTMAAELNCFVLAMFDRGLTPWLDLHHDRQTKIFEIRNFEFERDGVFAHGKFTELGKYFRDSNRSSGVSISTPVARWNNKPVNAAFDVTISKQDAEGAESIPTTVENMAVMGAVLIDGRLSAIQPYK
jgi:hypothetical protein